ncbi:MAG: inositol monophosphatase family protein [Acidimicrobiia bacterium]
MIHPPSARARSEEDLEVALAAARQGGTVVREAFGRPVAPDFKGDVNPVTDADRAAEEAILEVLHRERPGDGVLAEEGGEGHPTSERIWIVDPLDGTVNFVHGIPQVAVSVALWERGVPLVGVVLDPLRNEEFTAIAGLGASLDGRRVEVSGETRLDHSLIVTGFPYDRRERAAGYATTLGAVLAACQGVRRLGSAALDLAWVAAGRLDGYWEYGLKPWDAAAGLLLVTEAGGIATDVGGADYLLDAVGVVAATPGVHRALLTVVAANLPDHLR